jgi:AcrR family transcriptional regulator
MRRIVPRSERKQREFQRREAEIIDTAIELFRDRELNEVTIEQIAEAAGIGKGTIYKHFRSKDEICARIIIQLNRAMRAEIAAIDPTLPFRQRLDRVIEVIWKHDMRDSRFQRRLNHHMMDGGFWKNLGTEMQREFGRLQEEEERFYTNLLQEAQQRGEIIDAPLEELLFCATATIDGAILQYWQLEANGRVSKRDSERYLQQLQDFVYRALSSESPE